MTQRCRFCRWLTTSPFISCIKRNREYTEQFAKSTNNCGDFELNVVDAFSEGCHPREQNEVDDRQMTWEEYGEDNE